MTMSNKRQKRSIASLRKSTLEWIDLARRRFLNHEQIVTEFEKIYNQSDDIDPDLEPVCILCMDGGGLRGYGLLKMLEAIQKISQNEESFCHQFDLIAGTSVGGVCALLCNQLDSMEEVLLEGKDTIDECREKTFLNISIFNALFKGKAVRKKHSLLKVFEKRFGSVEPLSNPSGVPTFTLCSSRCDSDKTLAGTTCRRRKAKYEPFILRTYDYPTNDEDNVRNRYHKKVAESSNSTRLIEAMAATSAVPRLVERVRMNVKRKERSFADGYLYANNPVVAALDEARRLYPKRPLGLVLSIGFDTNNDEFVNRAIDIARLSHPSLHYQRICPHEIFENFAEKETNLKKITSMEEACYDYIMNNKKVNQSLGKTLEKLFDPKREKKRWQSKDCSMQSQIQGNNIRQSLEIHNRKMKVGILQD